MLTEVEKNKMLEMLGAPVNFQGAPNTDPMRIGMVKIKDLIDYRGKTDEEIRAELALYDIRKRQSLQQQLAKAEASKAKIAEALAALTPATEG